MKIIRRTIMYTLNVVCRHPHVSYESWSSNDQHDSLGQVCWNYSNIHADVRRVMMLAGFVQVPFVNRKTVCPKSFPEHTLRFWTKRWRNGLHAGVWGQGGKHPWNSETIKHHSSWMGRTSWWYKSRAMAKHGMTHLTSLSIFGFHGIGQT